MKYFTPELYMRGQSLDDEVQDAVRLKRITQGHARALLGLDDPESQRAACQRVVKEGLSVRQTEALVTTGEPTPSKPRVRHDPAQPRSTPAGGKAPHVVELEQHLHSRFGTPVLIKVKGPSRGQIIIDFNTQEEFDRAEEQVAKALRLQPPVQVVVGYHVERSRNLLRSGRPQ